MDFHDFFLDETVPDCNFTMDKGLAYTEDRIVVYNVFLYKISKKVEREDARLYFEQFGEIKQFQFIVKKANGRRRGPRVGFVHFKDAKSAAEVLSSRCHKIDNSKLVWVKACDSWHQPQEDFFNIAMQKDENEDSTSESDDAKEIQIDNSSSIIKLDDDCLFIIYQNMRLREQINFASSHPRFSSVFRFYAKLYYKTIVANDLEDLTLWNTRQFFLLAGQYIETITGSFRHKFRYRVVNFIKAYCPNLQKIKLDSTQIKLTSWRKLLCNKTKLKTLILTNCDIGDQTMYTISKLSHLEVLVVSRSSNLTGHYLSCLQNLTKLRLVCCGYLQTPQLMRALACMSNLRFLDLRGSEQLSKKLFEKLPLLCVHLEVLQISCNFLGYDHIAKLPKLKNLSLCASYPTHLRLELFQQLAKEKSEMLEFLQILPNLTATLEHFEYISMLHNLKKLHISNSMSLDDRCLSVLSQLNEIEELKLSGCVGITNQGLLEMIFNCKKIKWVNIQNTQINNDFVPKVIQLIDTGDYANKPITFLVAGSKINELDMPENYHAKEIKSMVYFEFNFPHQMDSFSKIDDVFDSTDLFNDFHGFFNIDIGFQSDSDDDSDDEMIRFMNFHVPFDFLENYHNFQLDGDDIDVLFW